VNSELQALSRARHLVELQRWQEAIDAVGPAVADHQRLALVVAVPSRPVALQAVQVGQDLGVALGGHEDQGAHHR